MSFLFKRASPNTCTKWDHTFEWTSDHLSREEAEPLKYSWDKLADEALERLDALSPPESAPPPSSSSPSSYSDAPPPPGPPTTSPSSASGTGAGRPKRDLVALLRQHRTRDPVLGELWRQATSVPSWVDWEQLRRGQDVFYRYSGASVNGLAFQSLVGGMGAARVVEVLARTGGFSTRVARHRLYETTQYVLQCTRDIESIKPGGGGGDDDDGDAGAVHDGWEASIRVRLLHAAVRRRILKLERSRPGYYDVARHGVPISDLDAIGTIASFSASLIWLSFPRQGIYLRAQEVEDYVALWRYLGYLLGVPTAADGEGGGAAEAGGKRDFFASPARAKAVMESLLVHEVRPSGVSGTLARNVIEALASIPPTYASREFLSATSRWLLGGALCDALGIVRPPLYYKALVLGQCLFFMAFNYTYRAVPSWDAYKIELMRRGMWRWIVESEHGLAGRRSDFEFKYLPALGKTTAFESAAASGLLGPNAAKGVERRNLITFGVFGGVLAVSAVVGIRILGALARMVMTH